VVGLGVVAVAVVSGGEVVVGLAVVSLGVVAVVVGAAMAVVVVWLATVVRLVECSGGGLWAPARRPGAAAQPAVMIPTTPATSSARGRPPRPVVRVTGSLWPRSHGAVVR
jgi:hypothetical protein